jgi:NitT/TauT family transport system substrate-binding protein
MRIVGGRAAVAAIVAGAALTVFAATASAQVPEIRFARQFSMGYLQFNVMKRD